MYNQRPMVGAFGDPYLSPRNQVNELACRGGHNTVQPFMNIPLNSKVVMHLGEDVSPYA
jgi:hypothetical protein